MLDCNHCNQVVCMSFLHVGLGNRFSFKTRRKLNELLIESVFLRDIRKGTAWTDLKELNKVNSFALNVMYISLQLHVILCCLLMQV